MNFGTKAGTAVIDQQPTYHLAPNFTTRPPPDGPYALGTVVQDLERFWPLNEVDDRVPITKEYLDVKEDITAAVSKSLGGEIGILAKVLDRSVGGDASLKGKKSDDDVYHIQKLETINFFPNRKYLSTCIELFDVKDYLEGTNYTEPVYLITGMKVVRAATIEMTRGREVDANATIGATVPGGAVDVNVGANVAIERASTMSTTHTKPADFVLGIQVIKLYHSTFPFWKERSLKNTLVSRGAMLVDNDDMQDDEDEDKFLIGCLDDEDMYGLERMIAVEGDGTSVTWIIPQGTVQRPA
jgi:hypothetical protein